MAKKSKSESAAPKPAERALDENARGYWLTRAEKFANQGQLERLAETLDRLWPDAETSERWAWLALNAPAMLAKALGARAEPAPDACLVALADTALEWPQALAESLLSLSCFSAEFVADARALREANVHLAEGRDGDAATVLKRIGRDSRFRDGQRFLRGLGAFYRLDGEAARLALGSLLAGSSYSPAAAALLAGLGRHDGADPGLVAMLPVSEAGAIKPIVAALAAKHSNQALSALAAALPKVSPPLRQALVRDFPGALLTLGVSDEFIVGRMSKAIPGVTAMVDPQLLDALICEHAGYTDEAIETYEDVAQAWAQRGPARDAERALVYHRMGRLCLASVDEAGGTGGQAVRCADCGQIHGDPNDAKDDALDAVDFLEKAVSLAPQDSGIWTDLVRAAELTGDRKVRDKILERFVRRFPAHPTALIAASEAAGARGSFDKALGFAEVAAELLPLDRAPRALIGRLLVGKARKKFRDDRVEEAAATLREADALPLLDPDARQRVTAAAAVVSISLGQKTDLAALRAAATVDDPRPWLWTLRFAHEWWRFLVKTSKPKRWPAVPKAALEPIEVAVEPAELAALIQTYREAVAEESDSVALLRPIVLVAVESAPRAVSTVVDARLIFELKPPAAVAYAVARHAMDFAADELGFVIYLYEKAIAARRPPEDFEGADRRLAEALEDADLLLNYGWAVPERIRRLRSDIKLYLRTLSATPAASPTQRTVAGAKPGAKPGGKGRAKAGQKMQETTPDPKATRSAESASVQADLPQLALPLE